ncbi:DegQ family serine endoprotease [Devosia sp. ZB163]|uniref:DegQ family serine endoprotease n=1 Tax=Devosia sp. ZB163 TaxID=3025938 RepID=UPI00235F135F|nr:DegQ family serine endoprotease [Devosia sp. ZB163]MDC9824672.1 DegQ family serine endoprotease [Devosia sp. ZB163]
MSKQNWFLALGAFAAGAALIVGYAEISSRTATPTPRVAAAITPAPVETRTPPTSRAELQMSYAPIVKQVTPSVVNVYATTISQNSRSPFVGDPFFRRFFGDGPFMDSRPRTSQSLGSGVIVDAAGVVLTNHHVIEGATDIRISTTDGQEYPVDLVLDDPKTDLAVLKVRDPKGTSFPALQFADSDQLEVGDLVLAIGNPFGVGQTVTSGIVSALARTGVESDNYEFFIQTDAAINPGNSGGALVDIEGRLIGINTAIVSRSGGSVGIGFAIPANMAKLVAETGIAGGALVRPWFGARLQSVTTDLADSLGLGHARGALISDIAPGGPAEKTGFRDGDVILSVDGFAIEQPSAFDFRLATKPVGATAEIEYFRGGKSEKKVVSLEAPPQAGAPVTVSGNTRFSGTTVETITPAVAQELGLSYTAKGVLVRTVERDSPADDMGLRAGDLILNLNGRDIADAETFGKVANDRPRSWRVVLQRGGRIFRAEVGG